MAGAERKKHVRFAAPAAGPGLPAAPRPEVAVVGGGGSWRCGRGGEGAALRWCISVALCAAFLGLGMSIAVLGPTFPNLAANVHKNVSDIYYIFVGRSLGYLGGSVLGGLLFDCMNARLLLALSMFGTTVGLYGIPWCKKSLLLTVLMSVIGAAMGILDTESCWKPVSRRSLLEDDVLVKLQSKCLQVRLERWQRTGTEHLGSGGWATPAGLTLQFCCRCVCGSHPG